MQTFHVGHDIGEILSINQPRWHRDLPLDDCLPNLGRAQSDTREARADSGSRAEAGMARTAIFAEDDLPGSGGTNGGWLWPL